MPLGSCWRLKAPINCYENILGATISTQAAIGRHFQIIHFPKIVIHSDDCYSRIMVRLLEDGYECWVEFLDIVGNSIFIEAWAPNLLTRKQIIERLPNVLNWLKVAANIPNKYLWGGTIGPNYDCSGLVQTAFANEGIWLPRDAYQQEKFCQKVDFAGDNLHLLVPGDLIFFGSRHRCNHVAIHINDGFYWHSSGSDNGHNGIGINCLNQGDSISLYYRSAFRSVGRICRCYDGITLH